MPYLKKNKDKRFIYKRYEHLTDKKNFKPLSFKEEKELRDIYKAIEKFERENDTAEEE